jgi:hypothetical protein
MGKMGQFGGNLLSQEDQGRESIRNSIANFSDDPRPRPACSAWRASVKEAAVREAVVSPAGPSTVTMKLTGGQEILNLIDEDVDIAILCLAPASTSKDRTRSPPISARRRARSQSRSPSCPDT